MARIYAEEAERRGNKVKLAYQKDEAKQEDKTAVEQPSSADESKSQKPEQEVIVLRGGFTRWYVETVFRTRACLTYRFCTGRKGIR